MADILPFPLGRRVGLIRKQAARFVEQETRKGAEANLTHLLLVQRQTLLNKGVDPVLVEAHVASLEAAIRAQAWRLVFDGEAAG